MGSSHFITNLEGEIAEHLEYVPFGEVFIEERNGSFSTPYLYNGKELDSETGYYYYGARYYNPRVSLWLSVDPLAEKYPSWSPYTYTFNNPIRFVDPTGLEGEGWIKQVYNGNTSYTYDSNVNTIEEARAAGYSDVVSVNKSLIIKGSTTLLGIELSNYSVTLYSDGTVMKNGRFVGTDFITDNDSAIRNVQYPDVSGAYWDGPVQMLGGPGDPFGIWEGLGMIISGSSDSDMMKYAKYAVIPLITKGKGSGGVSKILNVEKGALSGKVHGNSLSSQRPTWGYKLYHNDGTFLKNGITSQKVAEKRYTNGFMKDKHMDKKSFPNRRAAYDWEAAENKIQKGPLNKNNH